MAPPCAISMPEANTKSHPKNNIVATVANIRLHFSEAHQVMRWSD
jgi:hypothetical protein